MSAATGHGIDCRKVPHSGDGYLHAEDHDGPYDVDGVTYCGRCHAWLGAGLSLGEDDEKSPSEEGDAVAPLSNLDGSPGRRTESISGPGIGGGVIHTINSVRAFKQPGWHHVMQAFVDGAREARANPDATEHHFGRAADGYTKRVFAEVDPAGDQFLSDIPEFEHAIKPSKPWPRTGGTKA